jgi:hypothetical protein
MLDVQFTDTIASALNAAMTSAQQGASDSSADLKADDVQRLCRRAAWQLMFDLDGQSLLDLALAKLSAEQDLGFARAA